MDAYDVQYTQVRVIITPFIPIQMSIHEGRIEYIPKCLRIRARGFRVRRGYLVCAHTMYTATHTRLHTYEIKTRRVVTSATAAATRFIYIYI